MDDLIEIIHQLSPVELSLLKKEMKSDKQKLKLLEYLLTNDEINNDEIIEVLNYHNNKNAYYTFKHRLLQDIIQFKLRTGKNKVTKIKEEINSLRTLLYSNQPLLLEKKLFDLLKRTTECEIYNDVREIYLCLFILYFDDPKKRVEYSQKIEESEKKEYLFNELEFLFYKLVFENQDQFYAYSKNMEEQTDKVLERMKEINAKLNSKISNFLYESSLLTCNLNYKRHTEPDYINRIRRIYIDYINSPLQFYYPNCKFAIQCLISKFYHNTGLLADHEESLEVLETDLAEIRGYRTYEDVYFYYLYSKARIFIEKKRYLDLQLMIENEVQETTLRLASNKINFYLLFLKGVANYYGGNYSKAYSQFLKARNFTKFLEASSSWVLLETSVFALMVLSRESNFQLIESEKKYLKRNIKRIQTDDKIFEIFLEAYNAKVKNKKMGKQETFIEDFDNRKRGQSPLQLLDLRYFLES